MPTLYLVIGPWASGKTSMVEHLIPLLPNVVVFDWDLIIPGLSATSGKDVHKDSSTWKGLTETWRAIITASLASQRDVMLCGPLGPDEFSSDSLAGVSLRCAYLDCPDEILSARLQSRGATESEIADELGSARALRSSGYRRIAAENQGAAQVAKEVAGWVRMTG